MRREKELDSEKTTTVNPNHFFLSESWNSEKIQLLSWSVSNEFQQQQKTSRRVSGKNTLGRNESGNSGSSNLDRGHLTVATSANRFVLIIWSGLGCPPSHCIVLHVTTRIAHPQIELQVLDGVCAMLHFTCRFQLQPSAAICEFEARHKRQMHTGLAGLPLLRKGA